MRLGQLGNQKVEKDSEGFLARVTSRCLFLRLLLWVGGLHLAELELLEALHEVFNLLVSFGQVPHVDAWHAHGQSQRQNELLDSEGPFGFHLEFHLALKH